ncbi:MAG TPA: ZIP family metal transporter, partial [Candidatus Nanoarchaeia archaeon]|nr:ZIP family metal transporter [Candidatus Nanoarchaeia archaeon]
LHEIPQELADFGVLIYSGFSRNKALLVNFATATTAVLGAVLGIALGNASEMFLIVSIPFAAGGFIYIAGANLIPELHKECSWKSSLLHFFSLLLGMGLMVIMLFIE